MATPKIAWVFETDQPDCEYAVYVESEDDLGCCGDLDKVMQYAGDHAEQVVFSEEPPDFLFD